MPTNVRSVRIDFGKKTSNIEVIPEGEYLAQIAKIVLGTNNSGGPQMIWDFTIIDGEYTGKNIRQWLQMGENSIWFLEKFFKQCGVASLFTEDEDGNRTLDVSVDESDRLVKPALDDMKVKIAVAVDTYNPEKPRNKVQDITWSTGKEKAKEAAKADNVTTGDFSANTEEKRRKVA
jgi:hypothetical protein